MKKFSTLVSVFLVSVSAFAGNYGCNNRPAHEQQACYNEVNKNFDKVKTWHIQEVYKNNYKFFQTNNRISGEVKADVEMEYAMFEQSCQKKKGCTAGDVNQFNTYMKKEYGKYAR